VPTEVELPGPETGLERVSLQEPVTHPVLSHRASSRTAYAAAHVVADAWSVSMADNQGRVDWDQTLAQRQRLWAHGLGVAEAMDTAQRGMGITWPDVQRLVRETLTAGKEVGGETVVGIATDTLVGTGHTLEEITDAYLEQLTYVEDLSGRVVLMASPQLAAVAAGPDDYLKVYDEVASAARRPLILHWLGRAFDPRLKGYWGSQDLSVAAEVVVDLIRAHPGHIEGIKVSLLAPEREVALRRAVPPAVKVFTGDDFNYVDLIEGDENGFSHALLGAFAAVAPVARAALARLDAGDTRGFRDLLEPTLPLSRLIFGEPTQFYKTGIVWLAYLQGQQTHFRMLGGFESGRSIAHLVEIFREADRIGLLVDPELAAWRMRSTLRLHGLV